MRPWDAALFAGYLAAVAAWATIARLRRDLWPPLASPGFVHPWREVAFAFVAVIGVLLIGQLWVRGIRIPATGPAGPLIESLNQLIIFSPILLLPALRRQSYETALLRRDRVLARIGVGIGIAVVALAVHVAMRRALGDDVLLVPRILQLQNIDEAVQVLLEDIAVAILLVRLAAAIGVRGTVIVVASLFAVAHLPTMIARGTDATAVLGLLRDVALGVLVLGAVLRSGDVLWFWPVHLMMDLTQFARVMGVPPG